MAVIAFANGTQSAVTGTEHFLTNVNVPGRYVLHVDLNGMQVGDFLELRIYKMVLNSGTPRVAYLGTYQGVQANDAQIAISDPPINNDLSDAQGLRFSLNQSRGTAGRSYPWSVLSIDAEPTNFMQLGITSLGHITNVDFVGQVTGSVLSVISGTSGGAGASAADVWSFTGSRSLNGLQQWNLVGNISGTFFGNISGAVGQLQTNLDKLGYGLLNNQIVNFSGTITNVFNVLNPVVASAVQGGFVTVSGAVTAGTVLDKVGYSLSNPQSFDLIGNISGTITNVYNVISGTQATINAADVWTYTGTKIVDAVKGGFVTVSGAVVADVRSLVGVSGTVLASAVQSLVGVSGTVEAIRGGFVTVSGAVVADVRSLVGISGTVIASVVQGGFVSVSGVVTAGIVTGNVVGSVGSVVAPVTLVNNQVVNFSGTITNVFNVLNPISVTGLSVNVGSVNVSGLNVAFVDTFISSRMVSGTVIVAQNNDKTGYFLGSPQVYDRIGNTSGVMTAVYNVISGTQATINPSDIWTYTGSRSLNGLQQWNLIGNITGVLSTVVNLVSGTSSGGLTAAQVWSYATRQLTSPQVFDLIGNISGTIVGLNVTVTGVNINASSIWSYSPRTLTYPVFPAPPVQFGNDLTVYRGDTWSIPLTGLGSLANHSKIYFTVKRLYTDKDTEAEVQISDVGGLLIINGGTAATPANGSITINNAGNGDITIVLDAVESAKLDLLKNIYYDVELVRTDNTVATLVSGNFTILGDSSRATS